MAEAKSTADYAKVREQLEELRKLGVKPKRYNLKTPWERSLHPERWVRRESAHA